MGRLQQELSENGFSVVPGILDSDEISPLIDALTDASNHDAVRRRSGVYAIRNLLSLVPAVAELSTSPKVIGLAQEVLGPEAAPVKGTLFDKTADANWLVPWHQDLTICVKIRVDADGCGPWTIKAGVLNVQPPVFVLERMLAIRVHLDDCDADNGPLRVLPGSHNLGRLNPDQIVAAQNKIRPVNCEVQRGGAVLMKPLILHASSPANAPKHRRVIHMDFAAVDLPDGLSWL